jgi:hypothetical protein
MVTGALPPGMPERQTARFDSNPWDTRKFGNSGGDNADPKLGNSELEGWEKEVE